MDSARDGRKSLRAGEANLGLDARVRRASLLWWAAAWVVLCLFNFTTDPRKAWPADLVGYAGGNLAGFGWSLLVARRLTRARRRLRRDAIWAGLSLAVLGGCVCGAVEGGLSLCVLKYLKLAAPPSLQFAAFAASAGDYAELCVGWCFIFFVISGADRLARIEEEISSLRVVAYESQKALFRKEFRFDFMCGMFSKLEKMLSLRKSSESQDVVMDIADVLRDTLDRWSNAAGRSGGPIATAVGGEFGASRVFVKAVMNLPIANAIYWIAVFALLFIAFESYDIANGGKDWLWYLICWLVFSATGYLACLALERASSFFAALRWWRKCVWAAVFAVAASYASASAAWLVAGLYSRRFPGVQLLFDFAFYYGCAFVAWYCLYFYAQAVRREVSQRALLAQAAEAAAAARNNMLRYQVRPHFLFNALNALYALIADRRWAEARAMTQALSQYIEHAFVEDARELVPISEQAAALGAYLSIERIRFGDRLRVRVDIPERLAHAHAPSLILHPLIENAMKYAVAATADPVDVEIAAERAGDMLLLCVRDSGGDPEAPSAPGVGIGLRNVKARLAGHYGDRGTLQYARLAPKGFVVEVRLPLEFACPPSAA